MTSTSSRTPLPYALYKDKVLAGWIGKSIGGVIGARLECHKELKHLDHDELWPAELAPNDDLDLQVLWLEAMQERSLYLTSADLADFWQARCWYSFCEYGVFLNNIQRGIAPPLSGTWNNRFFQSSEGCPIRAEIWGYVAPNNPELAAALARMDGQLDHGETSIQAEQFLAATASQALLTDDLETALSAGLSVVPRDCEIARALPRVRRIAEKYPVPGQAWRVVIREFGHRNANDAVANHTLLLLALFLGHGDFKRTMLLCANFGWDTDCTASTAGALLGTLCGTAALPADWKAMLGQNLICGINVKHQGSSLEAFAEDTCRIGVEMAAARNPNILFSDAPLVTTRPAPEPKLNIAASYDTEPVLWSSEATPITLVIDNPTHLAQSGHLELISPSDIVFDAVTAPQSIPAGGRVKIPLRIFRATAGGWIADKNLFEARWVQGKNVEASCKFGLCGARQWQLYGPYWDMWDKTQNEVCPYNNHEYVGGPFTKGLTGDCYNQYAHLHLPYLDEARLLREDIPEEAPLQLERGEDALDEEACGGFRGQACYYLVRTFRSLVEDLPAPFVLGRSGPFRAWLDGVEIGASEDIRCWSHLDSSNLHVCLTGKPQRLVLKLIRLSDSFDFSLYCMGRGDISGEGRGVSNILDCLEDLTPHG
jgi:ADP-ribosylglycohydrolase